MYRLLGPHINQDQVWGNIPNDIVAWAPPVVVTADRSPIWHWIKAASPKTTVIMRAFPDDSLNPDFGTDFDIPYVARELTLRGLRATGGSYYDYLQLTNEPAIPSAAAMLRAARFDAECARIAMDYGKRISIGNFSTGVPEIEWWDNYHQALEAVVRWGGVLNLHQYGWPSLDDPNAPWYNLRHRQVYKRLPQELRVSLVIGETGHDMGNLHPGQRQGFRGHATEQEYCRQLAQFDGELQKDTYVLGAAIFCVEPYSSKWHTYNVYPDVFGMLAEGARPLYRNPTTPGYERERGIDVSFYQHQVMWREVERDGITFTMNRASVANRQGQIWPDKYYYRNWKWSGVRGLDRGAYHYMTAEADIARQAECFADQINVYPPDIIDGKWYVVGDAEESGLTDAHVRGFYQELIPRLKRVTSLPELGIYTSQYKARCIGLGAWASALWLWVADYNMQKFPEPRLPKYFTDYHMRQYTSKGRVGGISGDVDMDYRK